MLAGVLKGKRKSPSTRSSWFDSKSEPRVVRGKRMRPRAMASRYVATVAPMVTVSSFLRMDRTVIGWPSRPESFPL